MAGPVVHNEFFNQACKMSNTKITSNTNIYAQGHDLLMYSDLLHFNKNRNISLIMSNYYFQEFIYNYLYKSMNNESIYISDDVRLFLYGYLSHHLLDSYIHPFILHYDKNYLPVKNETWIHGKIEALLDTFFIVYKNNLRVEDYKISDYFKYKEVQNPEFINNINSSFECTYGINKVGDKFERAFKSAARYLSLYRYDPQHLKYKLAIITKNVVKLGAEDFFYDENNLDELDKYMNSEHEIWYNIYSGQSFNDSLEDVYDKALLVSIQCMKQLDDIVNSGHLNKEIVKKIVPDRSAICGEGCNRNLSYIKYGGIK